MVEKFFYSYLILLPLMSLPKLPFMGSKIQYADLVFVPICIFFLLDLIRGRIKLKLGKYCYILFPLSVLSLGAFLHSNSKDISLMDFIGVNYLFIVFIVFSSIIREKKILERAMVLLLIVISAVCLWGLLAFACYRYLGIEWMSRFLFISNDKSAVFSSSRIASFLGLPEMFTNFSLFGLTAVFFFCVFQKTKARLPKYLLYLILIAAIFGFSRSLAGIATFLALMVFYFKDNRLTNILLKIISVKAVLFILAFAIMTSVFVFYPVTFNSNNSALGLSVNLAPDVRFYLAKSAIAIIKSHPFLGIGQGLFTYSFAEYLNPVDLKELLLTLKDRSVLNIDPHSLYLGIAAEMGVIFLLVFMIFIALILFKLLQVVLTKQADDWLSKGGFIIFAAIMAFLINGFFVDILSMRFFWVLLALGGGIINLSLQYNKAKQ